MPIEDDLPLFGTSIDESQVPPIHQKRIVAFVNTFLMKTAEFLDQFASMCEDRFVEVEGKLNRMEAVLSLLETKLDSVPDLKSMKLEDNVPVPTEVKTPSHQEIPVQSPKVAEETDGDTSNITQTNATDNNVKDETQQSSQQQQETPQQQSQGVKAKDDYRYRIYFKMVHFGVQPAAIKLKMQAEGVDPNLLDHPDLILPDGVIDPPTTKDESSDDESN